MGVKIKNWDKAGKLFTFTLPKLLSEEVDKAVDEVINIYTQSIAEVIEEQPSDWTPKSEEWTTRSGSNKLFIGETGEFFEEVTNPEISTRGVRAKAGDKRIFVGARYDVKHHSGLSVETLAEILQAVPDGTRNLFDRAYDRVADEIDLVFKRIGTRLK